MKPLLNVREIVRSQYISAAVFIIVILPRNCSEFRRPIPELASEDPDERLPSQGDRVLTRAGSVKSPNPGGPSQEAPGCAGIVSVARPPC